MSLRRAAAIAALMVAFSVASRSPDALAGDSILRANLAPNPSFEADGGWETTGAATKEKARSGSRSLKLSTASQKVIENNWTRVQAMSAKFAIKPSTRYTLSVWVWVPETFETAHPDGRLRGAHASLPIFDVEGKPIGAAWWIGAGREMTRAQTTNGNWFCMRRRFTTPPKAASACVRLGVADVGIAFFDDVSLAETGPMELRRPCRITSPLPAHSRRPVFRQGRWWLDGKPFFPFGFWGSANRRTPIDVSNIKRHHCNIVGLPISWTGKIDEQETLRATVAEAARQRVYVILLAHTRDQNRRYTTWTEGEAKALTSFAARFDNIIGWMLMDDAPCRTEVVDTVHRNAALLRRFDPSLPFMVDLIPRRGSLTQAWGEWGGFLDMISTYVYPIPYTRTLHFDAGLESAQRLVDLVQESVKPPMLWYVVQAHVQDAYRKALGLYKEHYLASPDQIRLMTYYVIQHGVRGIYYFRYRIESPEFHGADRMAEIGLMGCEMDVVGDFFAGGERLPPVATAIDGGEDERVEAVPFRRGSDTLYLLTRHGPQFQVHVNAQPCRVRLPIPASCKAAWRVRWPKPEPLPIRRDAEGVAVEIPDFDLTDFILASRSPTAARAYQSKMAELLPDVAVFAAEGAEAAAAKFDRVFASIASAMPRDITVAVSEAREQVANARSSLDAGDLAQAYVRAREAQRAYRKLISACVRHARDTAPGGPQFRAYRRLLDALVRQGHIKPKDARRFGHLPSYTIPKSMANAFDFEEPLTTVFYTLPRFYGAFADNDLLKELADVVERRLRSARAREGLAALRRGDFVAAVEDLVQ